MGFVGALRLLWRRRLLVVAGVALALAIAICIAYRVSPGGSPIFESRQYDVGVASASVLVDSQSSRVVDVGGPAEDDDTSGSGTGPDLSSLAGRARLLATLMASSPLKDQIGALAGAPSQSLIARVDSPEPVSLPTPIATGTKLSASDPDAWVLTVQTGESIPIITINTQAPTQAGAAKLATSAVSELSRYMKSVAAGNNVPNARQLVVAPLGPATSKNEIKGARKWWAVGGFFVLVLLWCAGICLVTALARNWRDAAAVEAEQRRQDEETAEPVSSASVSTDDDGASTAPPATLGSIESAKRKSFVH